MFGSILAEVAVLLAVSKGNDFSPAEHQKQRAFRLSVDASYQFHSNSLD